MENVYLTLNFLFHNWHIEEGELWAVVQPHVREVADDEAFPNLYSYIQATTDSSKCVFLLWGAGPCDSKRVVPVPFPDNCKIGIKLSRDDDTEIDSPEVNDLGRFLAITNPEVFTVANREPYQVDRRWGHANPQGSPPVADAEAIPKLPPLANGPFAHAYNKQLREAALNLTSGAEDGKAHVKRLPAMLQLAFWGGSRRRLPVPCFEARSANRNLMRLHGPQDERPILTTNLHSLLGLTFLVATKDQMEEAKEIAKLDIEVNGTVIGTASPDNQVWKDLFGSLDKNIEDPAEKISVNVDETLKNRGYVRQAFQSFELIRNSSYFRVTRSTEFQHECAPPAPTSEPWLAPTRFVARAVVQQTSHEDLQWQAYLQFEGTLARYRLAPVAETGSDKGRTILQFLPSPNIQSEFFKFFKSNFTGANPAMTWDSALFLTGGESTQKGSTKVEALTIRTDQQQQGDIYWIGPYDLPWDKYGTRTEGFIAHASQGPTLLFLGKAPETPGVLLLFPRGKPFMTSFHSDDVETHVGETSSRQSLGDRWELKDNDALPDAEFNVLRCLVGDAKSIAPQLCFPRLVEFDLAQSAGAIEGEVSVNYPPHVSTSYSAQNAILQELLNYNALIVLADEQRQNIFGQILPTSTSMTSTTSSGCAVPSGGGAQGFRFRFEPPTDAPPQYEVEESALQFLPRMYSEFLPKDWSTTRVARAFFKRLFEGMDQPRVLSFGVEHTLGSSLSPAVPVSLKSPGYADFPITLPTEVVLRRENGEKQQRSPDEDIPFLRVSYRSGPSPVTLHLHTVLLDDQAGQANAANRQEARIAACRAIAELAFAVSVRIKPRIYHFDYRQAFQGASTAEASGLGDCIVSEDGPEFDCTELKKTCYDWIYHNTPLPKEIQCSESSTLSNAHPNLLFVEFQLLVDRDPNRVPPNDDDKHWKLTWRPIPPGRSAATADRTADRLVYEEFQHHLSTLRTACAVIPALRTTSKEKSALDAAAIIGAGAGSAGGWIFREDVLTATQDENISAIICPLAFAPVARNSALGDDTFEIVTRYLERIDSLINSDPDWLTSDLTALRKNFERRVVSAANPSTRGTADEQSQITLWHLMNALLAKLSAATRRGDAVAKIASSDDALKEEVQGQVSRLLWSSPRIFGDAKAFMYTLVQGGNLKQPLSLPSEFVLFRSTKVDPSRKLIDKHPQPFLQALRGTSDEHRDLRFLEVLDEHRYGDVFELSTAEWKGIRRMLSGGVEVNAGSAKEVGVWDQLPQDHVLLPGSHLADSEKAPAPPHADRHIHLPSREPVVPPNHVFSGYFDELQLVAPEHPTIDLTGLSQGKWKQGSSEGEACAVFTTLSPRLRRADNVAKSRPDEVFFSMLYWITGDEESQKPAKSLAEVLQSYQNDEFLLFERTNAWPTNPQDVAPDDSVFRKLLNTEDGHHLPAVFDSANLERLIGVLSANPTPAPDKENQNPSIIFKLTVDKQGVPVALYRVSQDDRRGWRRLTANDGYEVSILRRCSDASRSGARQRLLLLITAKVDLWSPKAFRLVLQRNFEHFDKHFAQQTVAGGSPYANQKSVLRDFSDREPVTLKWRSNSLTALVKEVLLPRCFPSPPVPKWTDYDLSVTVRRIHQMTWMLSGSDGKETLVKRNLGRPGDTGNTSSFPLINPKYGKGQSKSEPDKRVCWFEEGTNDFFVDWLWRSETNLPFLRLSGLRVSIASESPGCEVEGKRK